MKSRATTAVKTKKPSMASKPMSIADLPKPEREKVSRLVQKLISLGQEHEQTLKDLEKERATNAASGVNSKVDAETLDTQLTIIENQLAEKNNRISDLESKQVLVASMLSAYQSKLKSSAELLRRATEVQQDNAQDLSHLRAELAAQQSLSSSQKEAIDNLKLHADAAERNFASQRNQLLNQLEQLQQVAKGKDAQISALKQSLQTAEDSFNSALSVAKSSASTSLQVNSAENEFYRQQCEELKVQCRTQAGEIRELKATQSILQSRLAAASSAQLTMGTVNASNFQQNGNNSARLDPIQTLTSGEAEGGGNGVIADDTSGTREKSAQKNSSYMPHGTTIKEDGGGGGGFSALVQQQQLQVQQLKQQHQHQVQNRNNSGISAIAPAYAASDDGGSGSVNIMTLPVLNTSDYSPSRSTSGRNPDNHRLQSGPHPTPLPVPPPLTANPAVAHAVVAPPPSPSSFEQGVLRSTDSVQTANESVGNNLAVGLSSQPQARAQALAHIPRPLSESLGASDGRSSVGLIEQGQAPVVADAVEWSTAVGTVGASMDSLGILSQLSSDVSQHGSSTTQPRQQNLRQQHQQQQQLQQVQQLQEHDSGIEEVSSNSERGSAAGNRGKQQRISFMLVPVQQEYDHNQDNTAPHEVHFGIAENAWPKGTKKSRKAVRTVSTPSIDFPVKSGPSAHRVFDSEMFPPPATATTDSTSAVGGITHNRVKTVGNKSTSRSSTVPKDKVQKQSVTAQKEQKKRSGMREKSSSQSNALGTTSVATHTYTTTIASQHKGKSITPIPAAGDSWEMGSSNPRKNLKGPSLHSEDSPMGLPRQSRALPADIHGLRNSTASVSDSAGSSNVSGGNSQQRQQRQPAGRGLGIGPSSGNGNMNPNPGSNHNRTVLQDDDIDASFFDLIKEMDDP